MKSSPFFDFESHLKIPKEDLQKILNTALSQGGDFSEIYLEYKIYNFINMEEDIIKETAESISLGIGIRVLSGEKTGYGYTNDFGLDKMNKAALTAASIASIPSSRYASSLKSSPFQHNYYPVNTLPQKESLEKKISLVKQSYNTAMNFAPNIMKVKVSLLDQTQYVRIVNSEGLDRADEWIGLFCPVFDSRRDWT
jgi:TldD protein